MRRCTCLIAIISIVLVVSGCGDSPTTSNPTDTDYFPMVEGDWWEYAYTGTRVYPDTMLWEEGSTFHRVLSVSGDTCSVEKMFSIWFKFGELQPDTSITYDTLTYVSTPDSLILLLSNGTCLKYLDLPLSPGKTWDDWTVISTDEDVITPAGTFTDCALITTPDSPYNTETSFEYCPDVGLIRSYELFRQPEGSDEAHDIFFSLTGSSYLQ